MRAGAVAPRIRHYGNISLAAVIIIQGLNIAALREVPLSWRCRRQDDNIAASEGGFDFRERAYAAMPINYFSLCRHAGRRHHKMTLTLNSLHAARGRHFCAFFCARRPPRTL